MAAKSKSTAAAAAAALAPSMDVQPTQIWRRAMAPGPDTRVKITDEYAKLVARDAYFWAWPLVNIYNRRLAMAGVKEAVKAGPLVFCSAQSQCDVHGLRRSGRAGRRMSQSGRRLRSRLDRTRCFSGCCASAGFRRPLLGLPDRGSALRQFCSARQNVPAFAPGSPTFDRPVR